MKNPFGQKHMKRVVTAIVVAAMVLTEGPVALAETPSTEATTEEVEVQETAPEETAAETDGNNADENAAQESQASAETNEAVAEEEVPADDPADTASPAASSTTQASTESTTQASTESASQASTESSTEVSTQSSSEVSTQSSTEASTESSTEASTQSSTEASTESSTEASTESATETATESSTEAAAEAATEDVTEATTEESTEETTEEDTEEEAETAANTLTFENDAYTITASYGEDAGLPADAQLQVAEITEGSDAYQSCVQMTLDQLSGVDTLSFARFFDVSFTYHDADGNEVKVDDPAFQYHLTVCFRNGITVPADDPVVGYYYDDGTAQDAGASAERSGDTLNRVSATLDGKDLFGVVSYDAAEEEETDVKAVANTLTFENDAYVIAASYEEDAGLPADAQLQVEEIAEGSDAYQSYSQMTLDQLDGVDALSFARFYDISFTYHDADGNEVRVDDPAFQYYLTVRFRNGLTVPSDDPVLVDYYDDGSAKDAGALTDRSGDTLNQVSATLDGKDLIGVASYDFTKEEAVANTLTFENDAYTITVSYGEDAGLPADAKLQVKEIKEGSDDYRSYSQMTLDQLEDTEELSFAKFFDIGFTYRDANGNEVRVDDPAFQYDITVSFKKELTVPEDDPVLGYYYDDGSAKDAGVSAEREKDTLHKVSATLDGKDLFGVVSYESYEAGTLEYEDDDLKVTVEYGEDAKIPADAELKVKVLASDSRDYTSYRKKAAGRVDGVLDYFQLYDISIEKDKEEIEPKADVSVSIEHKKTKTVPEEENISLLHMTEDGSVESLDVSTDTKAVPKARKARARTSSSSDAAKVAATATANGTKKTLSKTTFKTDGFSVFAEAGSLKTVVLTAEGDSYTVAVTFDKSAGIPADAELEASLITDRDTIASYNEKTEDALNKDKDEYKSVVGSATYWDIHFTVDGKEKEPADGSEVQVTIGLSDKRLASSKDAIHVVHFAEDKDSKNPEFLDAETSLDDESKFGTISFKQNSFSATGVVVADGQHLVILQGSVNNYYALKHDGSLTEVSVATDEDGSKNVTFPASTDADQVNSDYLWIVSEDDQYIYYYDSDNNPEYFYPDQNADLTDNTGVHSTAQKVTIDNDGHVYRTLQNSSLIPSTYSYYIAVNKGSVEGVYDGTKNGTKIATSKNAAKIIFASKFNMATQQTDPDPGTGTSSEVNLDAPEAAKTLTDNEDGTYDLTLSVKGKAASTTKTNKADVLVVFDCSSSMVDNKLSDGKTTRLKSAQDALDDLTDELLKNNDDSVQMSFIRFGNTASNATAWVSDKITFKNYYNDITIEANTGTNWEDAFQKADNVVFREEADKYVIFISDGNPTYYNNPYKELGGLGYDEESMSRWHSDLKEYATDNINRCYAFAKDDAYNLVNKGIHFYSIAAYQDISTMKPLVDYVYSSNNIKYDEGYCQTATDTESLKEAFTNIIKVIRKDYQYTNVTIHDQLTDMTAADVIPDSNNQSLGQFRYTITDSKNNPVDIIDNEDGTYRYVNSTGTEKTFKGAVCDGDGKITWSMDLNSDENPHFLLDDGYTYTCTFTVWPDQDAYDLVADLNNGTITYDHLSDEQKAQFTYQDGTYYLATNEDGTNVTYKTATTENGTTTVPDGDPKKEAIKNPDPVELTGTKVTIQKVWEDSGYEDSRPKSVTLNLLRDQEKVDEITLSEDNAWCSEVYISPGLIANEVSENPLNSGHTYKIEEELNNSQYELVTEEYNPFLINSKSKIYNGKTTGDNLLTELKAKNVRVRRGSISLEKVLYDSTGTEITNITENPSVKDDTFTFNMTLVSPGQHDGTDGSGYSNEYLYEYFDQDHYGTSECQYTGTINNSEAGTIVENGTVIYDANKDQTTVTATITLKPHEQFRMIDVPIGTTFAFTESTEDDSDYELLGYTVNGDVVEPAEDLSLGTTEANTDVTVQVKNRIKPSIVKLTKTDADSGAVLSGAKFSISKVVTDASGNETEQAAYNMKGDPLTGVEAGELVTIGDLPSGTYRLKETAAPAGYTAVSDITFTVDRSKIGSEDAVTITSGSSFATISYEKNNTTTVDDDYYVITVKNSRGYELPGTGGYGAIPFTTAGVVLMIAAAYIFATSGISRKEGRK